MLRHYLRIGWRNIAKNRLYSAINVFGLTFGLAWCMLIGLYIDFEISYDHFHENAGRIYRIHSDESGFGLSTNSAPALYDQLGHYPEVEAATRVFRHWLQPLISRNKEKGFIEDFLCGQLLF
jgi:putative ABC transport system permease protein